ncbi:hypothetical protein EV421DRAFT_1768672 [Armillaria borealis]|uniref:Uncharacterized protein n=1 Tax=Armillaria borealis TaxID=47425 RepID=A0AA39MZ91_9AGAR|nr:hypothetical protein EV421DRAFT_1768672 [Armillaria borealis]
MVYGHVVFLPSLGPTAYLFYVSHSPSSPLTSPSLRARGPRRKFLCRVQFPSAPLYRPTGDILVISQPNSSNTPLWVSSATSAGKCSSTAIPSPYNMDSIIYFSWPSRSQAQACKCHGPLSLMCPTKSLYSARHTQQCDHNGMNLRGHSAWFAMSGRLWARPFLIGTLCR